jgi:hypothetical protein
MVIGPGRGNVTFHVIIGDGEFIPEKFNNKGCVIYRKGWMTFGELKLIKPWGELANPEDLAPEVKPACNYSGDGNPLHQHDDGAFNLEKGPFTTYEKAFEELLAYCNEFQEQQSAGLGTDIEGGLVLLEKFGLTLTREPAKVVFDEDTLKKENTPDGTGSGN